MAVRPSTTNYSNRFVDIEVLQTILDSSGIKRLNLSLVKNPSKVVTGMQKLVQRYTIILLSRLGDVYFDQTQGTDFWTDMLRGAAQNAGQVSITFSFASADTIGQLREEDENTELYGAIEDDERIATAELVSFSVDYATATLYLEVELTNLTGDTYTYVIPATVARR